jgi:hypothetical protein
VALGPALPRLTACFFEGTSARRPMCAPARARVQDSRGRRCRASGARMCAQRCESIHVPLVGRRKPPKAGAPRRAQNNARRRYPLPHGTARTLPPLAARAGHSAPRDQRVASPIDLTWSHLVDPADDELVKSYAEHQHGELVMRAGLLRSASLRWKRRGRGRAAC